MTQAAQPMPVNATADPISYATPAPRSGARVWAAAVIVFAGLSLVVLGGCFLIGILAIVRTKPFTPVSAGLSGAQYTLMGVLYVLAFGCFLGAVILIVSGLRNLYGILRQ
jgi:hypothetical protein